MYLKYGWKSKVDVKLLASQAYPTVMKSLRNILRA